MLSHKDLYKEINTAEKVAENTDSTVDLLKTLIKLETLNLKLLHNVRANMVAIMKKAGIELNEKKLEQETKVD